MKYRKIDKFKFFVLTIFTIVEVLYFSVMADVFFSLITEPEPAVPIVSMGIITIHSFALIVISVIGFRRIKSGHRSVLIPNFLIKIFATWIGFGLLCITMEPDIGGEAYFLAALVLISGLVVGGLTIFVQYFFRRLNSPNKRNTQTENSRYYFESDKAKWAWNSAAKEYCQLYNRSFESLSNEEKSKFYNYASNPIVYFLTWLIKNDFMSESFMQEHNFNSINNIKNERVNPVEFFGAEMAYVLDSSNISEKILPFMYWYYNKFSSNGFHSHYSTKKYHFDYYEVIKNYNGIFYCTDFSWEKYHRIEDKINDRYKYHLKLYEDEEYSEIRGIGRWDLFNTNLQIKTAKGVSDKYIESCIGQLNCLSNDVIDDLCNELIDCCGEELPEVKADKRKILNYLHPQTLIINTPHKNEPAFIVGCECDFEQEHGIAFSMRNDVILYVGYYSDVESPWSDDNEIAYAISNSIRYINVYNINSNEKISEEVKRGNLRPLYLTFNNQISENNMVFVPPIVADLKSKCDIMIEYLLFEGMVNHYSCYPQYKGNSLIPSQLRIEAKKDDKYVFLETIRIW